MLDNIRTCFSACKQNYMSHILGAMNFNKPRVCIRERCAVFAGNVE